MGTDLTKILNECIARIGEGEAIETCLAEYENMREQLEPLLYTALSVSAIPKVSPSDDFRRMSKARLMARLRQESSQAAVVKSDRGMPLLNELAIAWERLLQAFIGARRVAIPVTIAILVALVANSFLPGVLNVPSPPPALASQYTVSILSGSVDVRNPGADSWQQGSDGMTLSVGTRIKTAPGSHALLTFFEGSTIRLEPSTDVEIQQLASTEEQSTTIVLKQWLGRTWSRVTKMADPGSHYEIETPSAVAIVRGTLFTTEVDETGLTQVTTTEGLVSVVAQGEEVYLPASQQTEVAAGTAPSQSTTTPSAETELVITIDMPAVGSVIDPTGSSTGYLPSGLAFNQIPGSQSSSPTEGTQVITIPQPTSGEYTVVLRYVADGTAQFDIQGSSEGGAVYQYAATHEAIEGSEWLISLNIQVEDGQLIYNSVSNIEPLEGEPPESIVGTELAEDAAVPIQPPGYGPDGEGPPGWSEGGPPGRGPDGEGPPGWSEGEHPGRGPDGEGPPGWSPEGPPGRGSEADEDEDADDGSGTSGIGQTKGSAQGQGS